MLIAPLTASTANQNSIMGPNVIPILDVPKLCTENKTNRMNIVTGRMIFLVDRLESPTPSPSTALSTETAGVNEPSAIIKADPNGLSGK